MSLPPPGLGGGGARTGPPPGFGTSNASGGNPPNSAGGIGGGTRNNNGTAPIVKAQIVFQLTNLSEENFEKVSKELRELASANGHEMYYHLLNRICMAANPYIQGLSQHFQQYKEDPAAPPHNLPTHSLPAVAWRLLVSEAARAARDVSLAPQFTHAVLSPLNSTCLPIPSLRLLGLPPQILFALAAHSLAATHIFPSSHPSYQNVQNLTYQTYDATFDELVRPGSNFWTYQISPNHAPFSEDLSMQEARTLLLAIYPRSTPSGGSVSRPPTPTNPTSPHPALLDTYLRAQFIRGLIHKFASPAIIQQTLTALSPGGSTRSQSSIPLEHILFELGELTQDEHTVDAIIQRWWNPWVLEGDDSQQLHAEMAMTLHGLLEGLMAKRVVHVPVVVKVLTLIPGISWPSIVKSFDVLDLPRNGHTITLLSQVMLSAPQAPVPPIAGLLPASIDAPLWNNINSLLAVLEGITISAPDVFPIFTINGASHPSTFARVVDPPSPQSTLPHVAQNEARELQGAGIYNAMGFYVTLVAIFEQAESDLAGDEIADAAAAAGRLMDRGIDLAPELVLLGLERENERFNELPPRAHKARDDLWKSYLRGSEQVKSETLVFHSETLVYHQLYNSNPQRFIDRLLEFYLRKETPIDRVVHIGSELGILDKLLGHENTHLALDVAAVGAEREMLDLEMWLADGVEVKGDDFLQNIFDFVETRIRHEFERRSNPDPKPKVSEEATVYPLSPAVYSIFIRVIRNAENLSAEDVSRFKHLRTDILILHPSLLNFYPGSKEEQGFSEKKPAKDITVEVEAFFEAMYTGQTTLDACIQELKKKQASEDEVDREVFSWCLHSLFDEYKFITNYPPKELAMTSVLFGGIIDARLVKDIPAFVATRYVLDACKANVGEPTHNFGVYALGALRNSLVDFPGLCRSLLDIPVLHDSQPGLINDITAALLERQELDEQGGVKLAFSALKLPVLVEEGFDEFVEPEPKKKDQIMFIINQIAPSNYEQKSRDLQELFEDQYSRWFAHYFVEVRVALEVNRHDIYQNIVDTLNSPVLDKHILWETYRKARDLINNEDTLKLAPLRAQLKTVALWLGRITLARNKPIRFRELSLKDLLLQAQDNGRLIVAIPFVCQLLSRCSESVVFHLPNPWLHSLLALLAEFYLGPGLKIGLKFDIQLLFGGLGLVVDEFTPSNILQTRVPASQPHGDTPDRLETEYRRALSELLSGNRFTGLSEASQRMQSLQDGDSQGETAEWFLHRIDESIARLPESMVFGDYSFWQAPGAKRAVHAAVSVAIRDMLAPVVERSVTIAGISTRDLLAKDFSTEADPAKMRHAAQLMVKNLAGNLTLVTCREPLRERMTSNIKAALVSIGLPESASIDPVVESIVNDNLEAASIVLKDLTVDKASKDIDVNLAAHFLARQTHAESRSNQPFIDSASMGINIPPGSLPQMLRMIPGGLMPGQARVYEAFAQEQSKVYGNGEAIMYRENEHERSGYPQEIDSHSMAHSPRPRPMTIQDAMQNFQELAVAVDRLIAATHARAMSELPANHDLRAHISSVVPLISQVGPNDQASTALSIAQKVVQLLYRCNLNLGREAYVFMLQTLCEYAPVVDREVKEWLIYADDARKLNVPVTVTLIKTGMIAVPDLDRRMAQMLSRSDADADELNFVTDLFREVSTGSAPLVPRNAFAITLTAMLKLEGSQSSPQVDALLADLRRTKGNDNSRLVHRQTPVSENGEPVVIDEKKQAQLKHFFLDWVRTYQTSVDADSAFKPYIAYLHNEGILIGEDITTAFYKMAIHVAVDSFGQIGQDENASIATDSLAKLMVLIVKFQYVNNRSAQPDLARSSYYFRKIITILSYCLIERHMEMGENFDQKPWARIFTSLLSELGKLGEQYSPLRRGCLRVLAKVLGTIQPVYAPRFAFGWMSIVAHRSFMPQLLFADVEDSWSDYHKCLMWLLRFAEPFLQQAEMTHSSRSMYRGICRIFCVLMHDFPEFLEEYYHSFTTAIPPNCVQLRNIALSAFPIRDGPLPDPQRGLEELLPEMSRYPAVREDFAEALEAGGIRAAIDQHVLSGVPEVEKIVAELRNRIAVKTLSADGPVITWNRTLLHAAVYYMGTNCIARIGETTGSIEFDHKQREVRILAELALSFDAEGQYYFLSVVADQLRYPSAHTYFYISFMLYLFAATSRMEQPNSIPDRIGRVLLERIIVQRPHPFGLLVCFVELLEDQKYGFWHQPFAQAGELRDIFVQAQKSIGLARDDDVERREQKSIKALNDGEKIEFRNSP